MNIRCHDVSVLSCRTSEEEKSFRESIGKLCKGVGYVNRRRPKIINGLEQFWLLGTARSTFRQLCRKKTQRRIDEVMRREKFGLVDRCTRMFGYFRFPQGVPVISDTE
jgi:hypothetical protein